MILYPEALNETSKAPVKELTKSCAVISNTCSAEDYFSEHYWNRHTDKHI